MDVPKALRLWLIYAVLVFVSQRHSGAFLVSLKFLFSLCSVMGFHSLEIVDVAYAQASGVIGGAGILVQRAAFCFNNNLVSMIIDRTIKPARKR